MHRFVNIKSFLILLLGSMLLSGCNFPYQIAPHTEAGTAASSPTAKMETPVPVETATPGITPTATPTMTATATRSTPSPTPTMTLTPTWAYYERGQITAPILLYHQVMGETSTSRYTVSVPAFQAQMLALYEMGYTPIPISLFLDALIEGGELPEKPVIITFDDGHLSVYEHAFPIMEELGFPGVFYIVANRINNSPNFVDVEQLNTMMAAGWEIGSHSYTHADLTQAHDILGYEVGQSKADLQAALSTDIQTFAYPYGTIDSVVARRVINSGYRAGLGLGTSLTHTLDTRFYLDRIEVYGNYTLDDFIAQLNKD